MTRVEKSSCLAIPGLGRLRLGSEWLVIVAMHPQESSFCLHARSAVEMQKPTATNSPDWNIVLRFPGVWCGSGRTRALPRPVLILEVRFQRDVGLSGLWREWSAKEVAAWRCATREAPEIVA